MPRGSLEIEDVMHIAEIFHPFGSTEFQEISRLPLFSLLYTHEHKLIPFLLFNIFQEEKMLKSNIS